MQKYNNNIDSQILIYFLFLKTNTSSRYIYKEYRHNREFSSITSMYMFNKYIPLLVKEGFMAPVAGGYSLVSLRKVVGKYAYKGFSPKPNTSLNQFKQQWLLFNIEKIKDNQEYYISAKGGLKKDKLHKAIKGDSKAVKAFIKRLPDNPDEREAMLKPYQVFLSTRLIARIVNMSQKWVSNMLQNMRELKMIKYESIIKRVKEFIPKEYHYLSREYLFNFMGKTFSHMGSIVARTKLA